MRVRHREIETDLVVWDGTQAALQELLALGMDAYRFDPTVGDPTPTLVISSAEGDRVALPGWSVVKGVLNTGFLTVPPDVSRHVYYPIGDEQGAVS